MKTISNPLFNETLYCQDEPSTSLTGYEANYNGNISAMSWDVLNTVDQKEATHSYCFNYDNLSRLAKAGYTETTRPTANFSTSYAYDSHGNITVLKRSGRTGISSYGAIDDLTLSYQGNQLIKVEDAAPAFNISESSDFKNGSNQSIEYSYDQNGNLTKDLNKGISNISYNSLNLPISLAIANSLGSATNNYTYSADGKKLKVEMKFGNQTKTTDFVGNMIYENGALKRILIDGGYIENGKYYYYIQDHLGNNRVVVQANGSVLQVSHYYPFGMTFTENNMGDSKVQPYKYNGKEFDGERGLNVYDYSARYMDPALGLFMTVDPLSEKYYSVSPYAYCANNPILYIDLDGRPWRPTYDEDHDGNHKYNGYEWISEDQSYDADGNLLSGLYSQAIFFSNNGTFDASSKYNMWASTATIYLADGTKTTFDANTNPSSDDYATVPEGIYHATVGLHKGSYTALKMRDEGAASQTIELEKATPANATRRPAFNFYLNGRRSSFFSPFK